ncbi:hypothetical protein LTR56_012716 [Elasticomyces elasticus]|nr:hypothetical protein LTR22_022999 [Elasticomyces elasticus]KAK3638993.1 hypothetical protein LTR56_012716 [Elasticomyces elasticus]KAK4918753.1 hypothetical protein LTR49_013540 [Elasticomyces elasticus]KAK5754418.1 hypothetical protein LTS12_015487 [Elasticomyces elasticus]
MFLCLALTVAASGCSALAQSFADLSAYSVPDHSNTCLRRSVYVYTTDSSTYVVTNLGSTALAATPTFCANQTVTTARPTTTTVTIYQQSSVSSAPSEPTVLINNGFEEGSVNPFESSASSPQVAAAIAQGGPLDPYSGDDYLLITFDNSAPGKDLVPRQDQMPAPLVYNITQAFSASAGTVYTLEAYASESQHGASAPDCALTICGDDDCSPPSVLSGIYEVYSYKHTAPTSGTALAIFSIRCALSAYVGLDNITVTGGINASASNGVQYITKTETIQQTVTQTVPNDGTNYVYGTETATATQTQQIYNAITKIYSLTNTISTVLWSTATETIEAVQTKYYNMTVSELSTTTTTTTLTFNRTTTEFQPTILVETATATTTALITYTDFSVSLSISLSSLPGGTLTTTEDSTLFITTTEPGSTLPGPTSFAEASTRIMTSLVYSTVVQTTYISVTLPQATESISISLPQATQSISVTLPQATYTPAAATTHLTTTLEASTTTNFITITPPPVTQTINVTETLPQATSTEYSNLPASTEIQTQVDITTQDRDITQTLPPITYTSTLPAITYTTVESFLQEVTLPAVTYTTVESALPPITYTTVETQDITLPASTLTVTGTATATNSMSAGGPEPVPTLVLASPTPIIGDAVNGSPSNYDDYTYSVTLPVNISLYGQSSANVWVSTNGVVGITPLQYQSSLFANRPLPWFGIPGCANQNYTDPVTGVTTTQCFGDTMALALWNDLYIYQGTQQGIYYEVDGEVGTRNTTFEFYQSDSYYPNQYYHFLVTFYEDKPGVVTFRYLDVSDNGCRATVGIQSSSYGVNHPPGNAYEGPNNYFQYSSTVANVYPGLQITLDSTNNRMTIDQPGDSGHATPDTCAPYEGGFAGFGNALKQKPKEGLNMGLIRG